MKKYALMALALAFIIAGLLILPVSAAEVESTSADPVAHFQEDEGEGCLSCHEGIESIRLPDSDMMKEIRAKGECTTCHGGDPAVTGDPNHEEAAEEAHSGAPADLPFDEFYPAPGSVWVTGNTCGQCHTD